LGNPTTEFTRSEAIRQGLRELGYIEGQNIASEYRYAEGKLDRFPELAAELVRLKVDLIVVAGGDVLVQAAKNATTTIPIVMAGGESDPVEAGIVESLARPGGNVTGLTLLSRELGGKRLELFKEAVPKLARVAVLYEPAIPGSIREVKEVLPVAARALRLTILPWEVRNADVKFLAEDFNRPKLVACFKMVNYQAISLNSKIIPHAVPSSIRGKCLPNEKTHPGRTRGMYFGTNLQ
jgi:putative tryptophan/tyrosine transport system substrate-binding protein